jgi:hypothetical protein
VNGVAEAFDRADTIDEEALLTVWSGHSCPLLLTLILPLTLIV